MSLQAGRHHAHWSHDRIRDVFSILLACCVLILLAAPRSANADDGESLIESLGEQVIVLLKDEAAASGRRSGFEQILSDFFDVPKIARLVLGRYWPRADAEQRERYVDLFSRYVVAVYSGQFGNYGGQTFKVLQSRPVSESAHLVTAEIRGGAGPPILLTFRVHETTEGPKVVDVMVEGVSMLITMREEFASVVRREGIEGLLRRLEAKAGTV